MSIRKTYLPGLDKVKDFYNKVGVEAFVKRYEKVEVFIGPAESVDFINKIVDLYYLKDKKEELVKEALIKQKEMSN